MKKSRRETRYVSALCVWVPDVISLIEMCRYDSAHPASERESHKIERLIGGSASAEDHAIRLVRVARSDLPPTLDRWRSFRARVLDVRHPEDTPPTDAELAHLVEIGAGS